MDKNKTVDNINKVKQNINSINVLLSDVDKGITQLNQKFKDLNKSGSKDNAVTLYVSNKDNFKAFLSKLNSKILTIEKGLDEKVDNNDVKSNKNEKNIKSENKKSEGDKTKKSSIDSKKGDK